MKWEKSSVLLLVAIITFALPLLVISCQRNQNKSKTVNAYKSKGDLPMTIKIESQAFVHNGPIPKKYTGDGEDVSVPLKWSNLPKDTKELALICDDPDAPTVQPWVHWVIYKIPPQTSELKENIPKKPELTEPPGAFQGKNSWGKVGYNGPAPPRGHGVHHYHFKIYALDSILNIKPGVDKQTLLKAMEGHILAMGEIIGTYER